MLDEIVLADKEKPLLNSTNMAAVGGGGGGTRTSKFSKDLKIAR